MPLMLNDCREGSATIMALTGEAIMRRSGRPAFSTPQIFRAFRSHAAEFNHIDAGAWLLGCKTPKTSRRQVNQPSARTAWFHTGSRQLNESFTDLVSTLLHLMGR
ncbi:hypothetical protein [Lichenihabitans psoromatis]|uniref:hypothetical protein n=1 Tax=Lichenihabitans psoromatis TaxID=2528642 RepID=UPI00103833AF|nr:hypothetical protein [Lichenihabitans psoromatis]